MRTMLLMLTMMVTVSSGGCAQRRAASQETEASQNMRPALSPASVERRRCVAQATESCYSEHLDDRQATSVCLPVRISTCEITYRRTVL